MAKRLSNRQRIERMAEEASIKAEDKEQEVEDKEPEAEDKEEGAEDEEPKPTVRKASRSRKTAPKQKRMKFVWKVVDENSKEIASFPYPAKEEAEARAAELSEKTHKTHTVNCVRVPMADDE
jgi:hypothetical protein